MSLPLTLTHPLRVSQYFYSSQIILLGSLYASKCSMVLLLKKLFAFSNSLRFVYITFIIAGIAVVLTASANCIPEMSLYQNLNSHCSNRVSHCILAPIQRDQPADTVRQQNRWIIITVFDIVTETILFILPFVYLWSIQLRFYDKAKVILAFSSRLR